MADYTVFFKYLDMTDQRRYSGVDFIEVNEGDDPRVIGSGTLNYLEKLFPYRKYKLVDVVFGIWPETSKN